MIAADDEYTPTPAISHAILVYNRGRSSGLADGIVITPSHNPPDSGGFKYNPPNGGPADTEVTGWIETRANEILRRRRRLRGAHGLCDRRAHAATTHRARFRRVLRRRSGNVIDMEVIRGANVRLGVDPLGGAGVHYWAAHRRALRAGSRRWSTTRSIRPSAS